MHARRRFTRHATVLPAAYAHVIGDLLSEPTPSECHTIAVGGCMLTTGGETEMVDEQIVVHLDLPSGSAVDVPGTIVWVQGAQGAAAATMGVRFDAPDALPPALAAHLLALNDLVIPRIDDPSGPELEAALEVDDAPVATGTLAQTPLPRLLLHLLKGAFSGTLMLADGAQGRIELRAGIPVDAEHPEVSPTWLGRVLVEQGALAQERFDRVVGRQLLLMATGGESEDAALASLADVSFAEIACARRMLLERTLLRFFELDDAEFALYASEPLPDTPDPQPIDPHRLIHQGIRAGFDEARLGRLWSAFAERPARLRPARSVLERLDLEDDERLVIDRLEAEPCTLAQLGAAGVSERRACGLLYALYVFGVLELEPVTTLAGRRGPTPR